MHALVIGGTGMLRDVVADLAGQYGAVSVVARSKPDLRSLEAAFPGVVHGIPVDYADLNTFKAKLEQAITTHGAFDLAVVWIHDHAPKAPLLVADYVGSAAKKGRYVHVLSSAVADPAAPNRSMRSSIERTVLSYQEVILGFVVEKQHSRWLTNAEISGGVLKAIESDAPRFVVGTVEPWSMCP